MSMTDTDDTYIYFTMKLKLKSETFIFQANK